MPAQNVIIGGRGPDQQRRVLEASADGHLFVEAEAGSPVQTADVPVPGAAIDFDIAPVNTAAVIVYPAMAGLRHVITGVAWSYLGQVPVLGGLVVLDGAIPVFGIGIADEGCGFVIFPEPKISAAAGDTMTITLTAGGAACLGIISVLNHWTEA